LAYTRRGFAKYNLNEFAAAIADYSAAIKLDPDDAEIFYYRSLAYIELKKRAEAIADLKSTLKINPGYTEAKTELEKLTKSSRKPQ